MINSIEIIKALESLNFNNTFNPYFEKCPVYDLEGAPELRRAYLAEMLDAAAKTELDAIWVGRDLGYRGGRRTGLALTDDVHFADHLKRWGLNVQRPTCGKPVAERTATVIWDILLRIKEPIFLWNVFPLHPFIEGNPFSNRAHNTKERKAGTEILIKIIEYLQPKRVIAIGNDAYKVLSGAVASGLIHKVRHPSYGGQEEFLKNMNSLYTSQIIEYELDLFGDKG